MPAACIRRPVMTTLLMLSILLFGLMAYQRLPVSDLPNVDFPTIQVSARVPGASPQTMASAVATPEVALLCAPGMSLVTTTVTVQEPPAGIVSPVNASAVCPAVNELPAAPAHVDAISHVRLLASVGVSLMGLLEDGACFWVNPRF